MEAEFKVGGKIDFLSPKEFKEELASFRAAWQTEISRGVRWRQFSGQTSIAAGITVWTIGGAAANNRQSQLGPEDGFVWSVTRLAVSGSGFTEGTDTFGVFVDEATPTRLVSSGLTRQEKYDVGTLVLTGGQGLVLDGISSVAGGGDIYVSGQAVELPVQLAWQLL